jgi:ABC-type transport system involved in multi-copper enzyme maturation permease subunit
VQPIPNKIGIKFGEALTLSGVLITLTIFTGVRLQDTAMSGDGLGFDALVWSLATIYLAAMSFSAALATIGIGINTLQDKPVGSWSRISMVMLDFCLWLLYWLGLWGFPFIVAMILFSATRAYYSEFVAGILACLGGAALTIALFRILPSDLVGHVRSLNPYARYGLLPGLALFLVCIVFGSLYLRQCYRFELLVSNKEIGPDLTSRVDVTVSGRILNLNELRAQIEPVPFSQSAVRTVSLLQSEPGRFTGWINAMGLSPGNYRLSVYFQNYACASWHTRFSLWFLANNHQRRSAIFRVIKRSEAVPN